MERNSPYSDSPLLSEIHNLFPALLYDHARFRNIQEVFDYIRGRLHARYDIYSNATREFVNTTTSYNRRIPILSMNTVETIGQLGISDIFRMFFYSGDSTQTSARSVPTAAQIQRTTQRVSYTGTDEHSCAVCQDSIMNNDIVRKLNDCGHMFHDECVLTWFQRSSLCPMCRRDILASPTGRSEPPGPILPS
jgi:hypothetical protein